MIRDRWVFDDEYHAQILHRNEELRALSRLLEPATQGNRAEDILIHGPSGVGKTSTARWLVRDLRQRADVNHVKIECSNQTRHQIIHQVVSKHPSSGIVQKNTSSADLVETLDELADAPYIVILDEADVVPDLGVLDDLLRAEMVSVIAISHQHVEWLSRLEAGIEAHFPGRSQVEFSKYREHELVDILEPRVENGLVGNPVRDGQLKWISDETNGVARWAIKSVLAAAELAEERSHDRFHENDVCDSFERAKDKIRRANLRSLPVTHLRLYEVIRRWGPFKAGEMKGAYLDHRDAIYEGLKRDAVTWRRAQDFLSKMEDYDLIEMPGKTNAKIYEVVDSELEAPVQFNPLRPAE